MPNNKFVNLGAGARITRVLSIREAIIDTPILRIDVSDEEMSILCKNLIIFGFEGDIQNKIVEITSNEKTLYLLYSESQLYIGLSIIEIK